MTSTVETIRRRIATMTFGDKVRRLMLDHDLRSQVAFAKAVGVSKSTVTRWLSQAYQPKVKDVMAIKERFGVSLDFLCDDDIDSPGGLGREEEMLLKFIRASGVPSEELIAFLAENRRPAEAPGKGGASRHELPPEGITTRDPRPSRARKRNNGA